MIDSFCLALTGSIGMGKSTTAEFFSQADIPVWDADAAVHRLYQADGLGAQLLGDIYPGALAGDGSVDRIALREIIQTDYEALGRVEEIIHPLVAEDRAQFIETAESDIVVCDIPILFETGGHLAFDGVLVVTAPPHVQKERVLARPGMTEAAFEMILSRQMPDEEKRDLADFIIDTSQGMEHAQEEVLAIIDKIRVGMSVENYDDEDYDDDA